MNPKNCTLCNSKIKKINIVNANIYGDKEKKRKFYLCKVCDVRFMYPTLSTEEEAKFYKMEFEKFMDKRSGSSNNWLKPKDHLKSNKQVFIRRFDYLKKFLKKKDKILEVGCSSGFMLKNLISKNFSHCYGIEPSGVFSKFLKKEKIKTFRNIEEIEKKKLKFDVIMHFFVLEHIQKPEIFLKKQLSLLNKNGRIIFEIPNVADPLHSIFNIKDFENFYWSIAHPWYFSETSLKYLLKKLRKKFKLEFYQRYDLSNHIIWNRDGKPGGSGHFTKIWGKKIENEYKKNLAKLRICDTLVGVIYN